MNILNEKDVGQTLKETKEEIRFVPFEVPADIKTVVHNISDPDILKCLLPNEISEYMVQLSIYALGLAAHENRFKSYINWCESNIKYIVGQKLQEVNAYSFNEKDLIIRSNEPMARDFETKKIMAQAKLDSIKDISNKIETLINTLRNFYFEKKGKTNGTFKAN